MNRRSIHSLNNARGFSLLEMIMVIVLVGVLGALFLPRLGNSAISLQTAVKMVAGDLRFAQELAMSRNPAPGSPIGITFSGGSGSYSLTDPAGAFSLSRTLPDGITISSGGTIAFNKYGEPETLSTITLAAPDGSSKSISVESFSGRVSIT